MLSLFPVSEDFGVVPGDYFAQIWHTRVGQFQVLGIEQLVEVFMAWREGSGDDAAEGSGKVEPKGTVVRRVEPANFPPSVSTRWSAGWSWGVLQQVGVPRLA